jgi:osmoprotectant transport system substrate-binding protein
MTSDDETTIVTSALTRRGFLAAAGVGALVLAGCGSSGSSKKNGGKSGSSGGNKGTVKIGDKGFTEEYLVADMYQDLLSSHGIPVSRHSFATVALAQSAITHGDIDLYPEYTGTGLLEVLKLPVMSDPTMLYDKVKSEYKKRFKLTWLDESPMNDTNAVAIKKATASKYNIKTMSDLAKAASNLTFVGLAECVGRPDCLVGLKKTYGMHFKNVITTTSPALNYKALMDGRADVAEVFSTDGQIAAYNLFVPVDDKHLWPPYHVAPVVRDDTLSAYPQIKTILNGLAPHITTSAISHLNAKVDLQKQAHATVAKQFLKSNGLM